MINAEILFLGRIRVEPMEAASFDTNPRRGSSQQQPFAYEGEAGSRRGCLTFHQGAYESGLGRNMDFYA